jgi:predicted glycogen debranching enzyme
VDAPLWFIYAVYKYLSYTNDLEFVQKIYAVMTEIIDSYKKGTLYDIRVKSALVIASDGRLPLTWMDATSDGKPVTPRAGAAVEVSSLWYNALRTMEVVANETKKTEERDRFAEMAKAAYSSFNAQFWNEKAGCLFDVVREDGAKDEAVRPNQVISMSLPFPVLEQKYWKSVMKTIDFELLTPVGLRTLSPGHPSYIGKCMGPPSERDAAYHQGTVWPWLLGHYITSYIKLNGKFPRTMMIMKQLYEPFRKRFSEAGIGMISEIFDGDEPNAPRGCISQAWSVAEILRSYLEDVSGI